MPAALVFLLLAFIPASARDEIRRAHGGAKASTGSCFIQLSQSKSTKADCDRLSDMALDCDTRIGDRAKDGGDYCADEPENGGCKLSCCSWASNATATEPASCDELEDLREDCDTRIEDRAMNGGDYCADVDGDCEKSCCSLANPTTTTTPAWCNELSDTASDCATRIQDRAEDGGNYCADEDDDCELSCCVSTTTESYVMYGTGGCRRESATDNPSSSYTRVQNFSGNLAACEALCDSDDACKAVEFRVGDTRHCELHTEEPEATSGNSTWMCLKKVTESSTTEP